MPRNLGAVRQTQRLHPLKLLLPGQHRTPTLKRRTDSHHSLPPNLSGQHHPEIRRLFRLLLLPDAERHRVLSVGSPESVLPVSVSVPHQSLLSKSHQPNRVRGDHPIYCGYQRCPLFFHHRQHSIPNPKRGIFLLQHQLGHHNKTQHPRQFQLRDPRKEDDLHQWHYFPYLPGHHCDHCGEDRPDHQENGQLQEQLDEGGEDFHRGR